MHTIPQRILFWTPRILSILFALFLSIFALDVFGAGYGIGETILALLIHLIPTYIVLIALVLAWRREWVGAILFPVLAVFFLLMSRGEGWIIAAPPLLIGGLFLATWMIQRRSTSHEEKV